MTDNPSPCDCGAQPTVIRILGSRLGLRCIGCSACRTAGPARMDTDGAIAVWNEGRRSILRGVERDSRELLAVETTRLTT